MKKSGGFTLIELIAVIIIIGILGIAVVGGGGGSIGTSDGDRVGIITKLSNSGLRFKTWEGEMILGGQGTVNAAAWKFSVADPEILKKVKSAVDSQKKVRLTYHKELFWKPWDGATTYFINGVTPVDE